ILCTGEPIMFYWKMLAAILLPSKVLVINENADYFWLDVGHRKNLRQLLGDRWGVNLEEVFWTLLRAIVFPATLLILLLTAFFLYARRWWRLLSWKIGGLPSEQFRPEERFSSREEVTRELTAASSLPSDGKHH